jgi:enoyl-CoA hydratase
MGVTSEVLTVERNEHVATVWLDNPAKRNAMGEAFWRDMPLVMNELSEDNDVRAVVIAGRGPAFSAGIDLAFLAGGVGTGGTRNALDRLEALKRLQASLTAVDQCRKPTISAVHGWCVGAGIDLITATDIRLCSADATFSVRETRLAIVADVGTLQRLPRIIGKGHTLELCLTGKDFDAQRAEKIGLVNDVLPDQDSVVKAAQEMAAEIASLSPLAVQGTKRVLKFAEDHTIEEGLDYVALWNQSMLGREDVREAMTAFMEKRPPKFTGA